MMSLQQATKILNGEQLGNNVEFNSISTDTRTIGQGDLYFALQGERFDGHDYIDQAMQKGASAAVVHKDIDVDLPLIKVEDTRKALGSLAASWRDQFKGGVVAITGSNGKTTVKEMVASILSEAGEVLATKGNFNNDIGLPLTLFNLNKQNYAVIEMGANHHGEIQYLTNITQPDVALITNAGPAHLEGFGSIQGVAKAKGEIYQGLKADGTAIINLDDDYSEYWRGVCTEYKTLGFSMHDASADVLGKWHAVTEGAKLDVVFKDGQSINIKLKVHGIHNGMNALAAIAAAEALHIPREKMVTGLNKFRSVEGRLNFHRVKDGLVVIDDVLKELPGEHWLVLGDMGELGGDVRRLHFDAGLKAQTSGLNKLLAVGDASRYAVEAFGEGAEFFDSKDQLFKFLAENKVEPMGVLVKGSRFMQMEEVVNFLTKEAD